MTKIAKGSTGNKTLYAKWIRIKYNISYRLNKGTNVSGNPAVYYVTSSDIRLRNPKKAGYKFAGWYSDSAYKKRVTKIPKGSTGNKTLYAKWTKEKYKITYKLNGGKNISGNPTSYYVTSSDIVLKSPKKKGYKFAGWYSDAGCRRKITKIAKGSTGNKTLYAKWKK